MSKEKSNTKQIDDFRQPTVAGQVIEKEFADFALEGEFVKNLKDKRFTIVGQRTQMVDDMDSPGQQKAKLILTIRLTDATIVDYYPNKTSQKTIIARLGSMRYSDWVGFEGEFVTKSQRVGPLDKEVIYIQ